jgi:CRP/FNR family transcriptional regulator, cyclic AMP receptor protein
MTESERPLPDAGIVKGLPESARKDLSARLRWHRLTAGTVVVNEGDGDQVVRIVGSGRLRATSYSANGNEVIFRNLVAGDVFGDYGAIDGQPRSAHILVIEDSWVGALSGTEFIDWVSRDPAVVLAQMRSLTAMIRVLTTRVVELSTLKASHRIQSELLRIAMAQGASGNSCLLRPIPSHREIAARTGTQREVVSRELSRMEKLGLIERESGCMKINDLSQLRLLVARAIRPLE